MSTIIVVLHQTLLMTLLINALSLSCAIAGEIYVIAHPESKITPDAIRDVFIGDKQFAGPVKLVPVDNAAGQTDFLDKVMKMDQTRYANLWVKKSFRDALNPPAVRSSDKDVVEFVRKTPGALSYVSSAPPPGVTVVQKF